MIIWFIGQSGVGKSTLAKRLKYLFDLPSHQIPAIHLDGDDLRRIFGGNYKSEHFTKEYRDTNTRKLQDFVEHIDKQGISVIVSTVNSDRAIREELKLRNKDVIEIYVVNSGEHVRAEFNRSDFEEPLENFIKIDTFGKPEKESFDELISQIFPRCC